MAYTGRDWEAEEPEEDEDESDVWERRGHEWPAARRCSMNSQRRACKPASRRAPAF